MSKFIKLTNPDGAPVYVSHIWVQEVLTPRKGVYLAGARSEIILSSFTVAVKETPEEVVKLLEKA